MLVKQHRRRNRKSNSNVSVVHLVDAERDIDTQVTKAPQHNQQQHHLLHVDPLRVNVSFKQSVGSCVIASYAIAANYFTGRPIESYFEGYCEHFGLKFDNALHAESVYAGHFDAEWRKRDCRGYEVALDLHEHSHVQCFAEARQIMRATFFLDSNVVVIEDLLQRTCSFLNITYEQSADEYHSITVFSDSKYFFGRNTNMKLIYLIKDLKSIGILRDSLLFTKKEEN